MPTAKQTAANRANSQESTAPPTTAGQTASRYNAVKHGIFAITQIMFDETAGDLAELAAEYHEHHSPADTDQRLLVDTLVHNEWRLRRMRRVEAVLWEHAADAYLTQHPEAEACNSAHAFATNSDLFERLQRMVNGCERNYHRAFKELHRLKEKAKVGQALPPANVPANPGPLPQEAAATTPQPEQSTTTSAKLVSFRQNPKTPPPAPPFAGPLTVRQASWPVLSPRRRIPPHRRLPAHQKGPHEPARSHAQIASRVHRFRFGQPRQTRQDRPGGLGQDRPGRLGQARPESPSYPCP